MLLLGAYAWQYRDWRAAPNVVPDRPYLYPAGLPQRLWLEHYVERFATVEVNNAFYRLPERSTFEQWRSRTPADFRFAGKMSRYLTHIKRLKDPAGRAAQV